ncbi:MAG TPA: hypothetical protein VGI91_06850 [Steroidobacteraceae bacterium]|jgi:hypothetical protein
MMNPIARRNGAKVEWVYAVKASHVVTVLVRVRSTLMVRVDAAGRAKVVLGSVCIELIEPQFSLTLNNSNPRQRHGRNYRTLSAANRTVTAMGLDDAVWQGKFQLYSAAVA